LPGDMLTFNVSAEISVPTVLPTTNWGKLIGVMTSGAGAPIAHMDVLRPPRAELTGGPNATRTYTTRGLVSNLVWGFSPTELRVGKQGDAVSVAANSVGNIAFPSNTTRLFCGNASFVGNDWPLYRTRKMRILRQAMTNSELIGMTP